jgi:hypothetical protein
MKLEKGDIFSIPLQDKGFGLGQIVKIPDENSLSVVIFSELFPNLNEIKLHEVIAKCTPLFFGNTFDAKLYHKHWKIIGNDQINLNRLTLPFYKIGSFPTYIEDFDEKRLRRANKEEKEKLIFRKYIAPVRLENALLAFHGLKEWRDDLFNSLLYSYNIDSNNLVSKN